MPAKSKAQQRAVAMALAAKRGEILPRRLKGAALQMYKSMTERELREFAATSTKRLPAHKKARSVKAKRRKR